MPGITKSNEGWLAWYPAHRVGVMACLATCGQRTRAMALSIEAP
jgi:hypothetical protein